MIWRLERSLSWTLYKVQLRDLIDQVANLERRGVELVSLQERIDTPRRRQRHVPNLGRVRRVRAQPESGMDLGRLGCGAGMWLHRRVQAQGHGHPARSGRPTDTRCRSTVRSRARLTGISTNTLYRHLTPDGGVHRQSGAESWGPEFGVWNAASSRTLLQRLGSDIPGRATEVGASWNRS